MLNEKTSLTYKEAVHIIAKLVEDEYLTVLGGELILSAVTDKALANPFNIKDSLRLNIIKEVVKKIMLDCNE